MSRTSKRETLLVAAAEVVRRQGIRALTLEAVAAQAGVSKGGLLYHFSSKEELVAGLVEALLQGFETAQAASLARDPRGPGNWSRAYVRATVDPDNLEDSISLTAGLLAGIALDPRLLEPMRERYAKWDEALESDGLPGVDAHIVRLATDGIWVADLLGLAPPVGERRRFILERLLELAGGDAREN